MGKAIGMVEYKTVSTGIKAADTMIKTAAVRIVEAQTVCPGKYIVIITGELSAVKASVDASKALCESELIDGEELYLALKERGILVRHFTLPRIKNFNRITIGTKAEMETLVSEIKKILEERR